MAGADANERRLSKESKARGVTLDPAASIKANWRRQNSVPVGEEETITLMLMSGLHEDVTCRASTPTLYLRRGDNQADDARSSVGRMGA